MLTDPVGAFRSVRPDGTVVDLSSYDELGFAVRYRPMPDGNHEFIDFAIYQ